MKYKKNQQVWVTAAAVLFLSAFGGIPLEAEALVSPEWKYALDLPEGYALQNRNGSIRYHFQHQLYPVDLQMAIYPSNQFEKAENALTFVSSQLESITSPVSFIWRFRSAAIGQLAFQAKAGWILSVDLADKKGYLVMACFTDESRATELEGLMISTLDSVFTDDGSYFETGPMTAFAWAKEKPIGAYYEDAKQKTEVPFDSIDAEAAQSVVDREFQLLTSYLDTPLVFEAWKRYYRLIYRDSWSRLAKPAFIIKNRLPADALLMASELLAWTQTFTYERNFDGSDFLNLPEAFVTRKADCDSRSLLMVLLLNQMGVDAVLLVSPEYSHSVAAVDCPGEGARFTVGKKSYLIADTTAKVAIGKIAQDMADSSKWFAVTFYAFPQ
jgi:hypothetical protein